MKLKVFFAFLGIIAALGICEAAFRLFEIAPKVILLTRHGSETAYHMSPNPILGYELTPNFRSSTASNHFGSFRYVNSDGRRDIERTIDRIPGRKRLIMLGDSVVAGHGVDDLEDTISRNLERLLGDTTEVLNFGVGGYNTLGESELLALRGLKYSPDAVVLICVDNDNDDINGDLHATNRFLRPRWSEDLFLASDVYRYVALHFNLFHFRSSVMNSWERDHRGAMGVNVMERGFERLYEISEDYRLPIGVAIWPRFKPASITEENFPRAADGIRTLPEQLAERYNFPVIHLERVFNAHRTSECALGSCPPVHERYTAGADTIHPNPEAAEIAAGGLKDFVDQLLNRPNSSR